VHSAIASVNQAAAALVLLRACDSLCRLPLLLSTIGSGACYNTEAAHTPSFLHTLPAAEGRSVSASHPEHTTFRLPGFQMFWLPSARQGARETTAKPMTPNTFV
jgi:hypothetical protein